MKYRYTCNTLRCSVINDLGLWDFQKRHNLFALHKTIVSIPPIVIPWLIRLPIAIQAQVTGEIQLGRGRSSLVHRLTACSRISTHRIFCTLSAAIPCLKKVGQRVEVSAQNQTNTSLLFDHCSYSKSISLQSLGVYLYGD